MNEAVSSTDLICFSQPELSSPDRKADMEGFFNSHTETARSYFIQPLEGKLIYFSDKNITLQNTMDLSEKKKDNGLKSVFSLFSQLLNNSPLFKISIFAFCKIVRAERVVRNL